MRICDHCWTFGQKAVPAYTSVAIDLRPLCDSKINVELCYGCTREKDATQLHLPTAIARAAEYAARAVSGEDQ